MKRFSFLAVAGLCCAISFAAIAEVAPSFSSRDERAVVSSVGAVALCSSEECGPQLGMPNRICADGYHYSGPTGRCLRQTGGQCGWEIASCPAASDACKDFPCADRHHCEAVPAVRPPFDDPPAIVGTPERIELVCYPDGAGESGDLCTGDHPCGDGLLCCYPCGIQGCRNSCMAPWPNTKSCPMFP